MKTLHLFMGLIIFAAVPLGCETGNIQIDNRIQEIESGEILVELKLEEFALTNELFILEQNVETEEEKERIDVIYERLKVIKQDLVFLDIGPIPGPKPCTDQPANCPIPLRIIKKILTQSKFENFKIIVSDPKSQEVLYVAEEFNESEIVKGFLEYEFSADQIQSDELVLIEVQKTLNKQDLSYNFFGIPTE